MKASQFSAVGPVTEGEGVSVTGGQSPMSTTERM